MIQGIYVKRSKKFVYWESERIWRYFYFAQDAADNFLERELGMKRGISGELWDGKIPPSISILGCQIRKKVSVYGVK